MLRIRKLDAFLDRGPDPVLHKRKNIKLAQLHDLRGQDCNCGPPTEAVTYTDFWGSLPWIQDLEERFIFSVPKGTAKGKGFIFISTLNWPSTILWHWDQLAWNGLFLHRRICNPILASVCRYRNALQNFIYYLSGTKGASQLSTQLRTLLS